MTPQSEKYVDGSAFTSVDDMRLGEYDYRQRPESDLMTINEGTPPSPTQSSRPATPSSTPARPDTPTGKAPSVRTIVLVDELLDDPHAPAFDFEVVKDEKLGIYDAIVGDREVPGLTYDVARRLPPRTNPREARTTSSSPRSSTT